MATSTGGDPHLERAYSLSGPADARALYDEWAPTYDADLTGEAQGYVAPAVTADAVVAAAGPGGEILDAGCGTGLVGVALRERGATTVDGIDLSVATVLDDVWESGGYRAEVDRLAAADVFEAVSIEVVPYRSGQQVDCRLLVLRVR